MTSREKLPNQLVLRLIDFISDCHNVICIFEFKHLIDLHSVLSQCASFIEAHYLQIARLYGLLRLNAQNSIIF